MSLKKTLLPMMVASLLLVACGRSVTVTQIDIIPEPVFLVQKEGSFILNRNFSVAVSGLGQNSPTAKYIMNSLRHAHLRPSLVARSEESDIELILNDNLLSLYRRKPIPYTFDEEEPLPMAAEE